MQLLHKLYDIKHMSNSKIYKLLTTQKYSMVALTIGYLIPFIPSATVSYVNILINKNDFKKQLTPIVIGVSFRLLIFTPTVATQFCTLIPAELLRQQS